MALQSAATGLVLPRSSPAGADNFNGSFSNGVISVGVNPRPRIGLGRPLPRLSIVCASGGGGGDGATSNGGSSNKKKGSVPNSNYVVPLDKSFSASYSSCITRPLVEILRDLNKRIPDNVINKPSDPDHAATFIPWYHANRMLSFFAPGWCGEIRDVIFSDNGSVTVVYRLTIRGSDGEAHREATGTVSASDRDLVDPVAAAEEIAFCKACARFGLGLYLYHEE